MSFRQFGGLNYSSKNNIVSNNLSSSNNLNITGAVGQTDSNINILSDITGNIKWKGDIEFTDNIIVDNNLSVLGNVDISNNLLVIGDTDMSGNLNAFSIILTDPSPNYVADSVVTKSYVDAATSGLVVQPDCLLASTGNINLSSNTPISIDSVLLTANGVYNILIFNQNNNIENGIYFLTVTNNGNTFSWARASFMPDGLEESFGFYTYVTSGEYNSFTGFVQIENPGKVGTDPIVFVIQNSSNFATGNGLVYTTGPAPEHQRILSVSDQLSFGDDLEVTSGNLIVDNNLTVGETFGVTGATTLSSTLSAGSTILASLGVTSNATVGGTFGVTGATTLSSTLSAGSTTLSSLGVTSNATVGGTFGVTGATTLSSTLSAGSTTLSSLGVTSNATVGGTFGVTGATTLSSTLSAGSTTLSSLAVTSNATVGGTFGVTGATTLSSTLSAGSTTLASLGVTSNATVGGTFGVTGATTLSSTLSAGSTTLSSLGVTSNATVGGTFGVTGATTLSSLGVNNNSTLGGTLYVNSTNNYVGINKNIPTPSYALDVSGNINFSGQLLEDGVPFSGITQWSNVTGGSGIYYNGGNVGIGTNNPELPLDVDGAAVIRGNLTLNPDAAVFANNYSSNGSYPITISSASGENINLTAGTGGGSIAANGTNFLSNVSSLAQIESGNLININSTNPSGGGTVIQSSYINFIVGAVRFQPGYSTPLNSTIQLGPLTSTNVSANLAVNIVGTDPYGNGLYQIFFSGSTNKIKENIIEIGDDDTLYNTETFMKLKPVFYHPKEGHGDTNKRHIGFIAEDIEQLNLKELVEYLKPGEVTGVSYSIFTAFLTKIIQTQQKTIDAQNTTIGQLQTDTENLKSEIQAIKMQLGM